MTLTLGGMLRDLMQVDEETWGLYAFTRELLNRRISPEDKPEMIAKAIACGREYALRLRREHGAADVRTIAERLALKVEFRDVLLTGKRVLFANYTPPGQIDIMVEPVSRAVQLLAEEAPGLVELFTQDDIIDTILGHEIFHYIEDQAEQDIYTRTERIRLWTFLGYKHFSTIRTLGEIAAMAFSQELNQRKYSPYILDVLLYYSYDSSSAEKIYRDVLGVSSGRCRKAVEDDQ